MTKFHHTYNEKTLLLEIHPNPIKTIRKVVFLTSDHSFHL